MTPATLSVTLACHPQTHTDAVRAIGVRVWRSSETLAVTFVLDADLGRLRIPPPRSPQLAHGLWEHTCFEAFVALDDTPSYHEFNFAPSGEWMIHAFNSYRDVAPRPDEMPTPGIAVRRAADRLEQDVILRLNSLSATHPHAPLRLALAAVIEDESGGLSYWALRHPARQPDFHHPDAFALIIPPGVDSDVDPR